MVPPADRSKPTSRYPKQHLEQPCSAAYHRSVPDIVYGIRGMTGCSYLHMKGAGVLLPARLLAPYPHVSTSSSGSTVSSCQY
eukprot:477421-Rhodomonas_salina.1